MTIQRHYIELLTRWEERSAVSPPFPEPAPHNGDRGAQGYIREHRSSDWFRNRVTIVLNPDHEDGIPDLQKIFNRGSLIRFLNAELELTNKTAPLPNRRVYNHVDNFEFIPRRLHYGYFGGWIGGASDQQIQDAYLSLFMHYKESVEKDIEAFNQPRTIHPKYLSSIPLQRADNPNQAPFLQLPCVCRQSILEDNAEISLYHFKDALPNLPHIRSTRSICHLEINIKDPNIDPNELMEAIRALPFTGTKYPLFIDTIHVRYTPAPEAPQNEEDVTDGIIEDIRAWQTSLINEERARKADAQKQLRNFLHGAEVLSTIPQGELPFQDQFPLQGQWNFNDSATIFLHRIPEGLNESHHHHLRIEIWNPALNISGLMSFIETLRVENLHQNQSIAITSIDVILHPAEDLNIEAFLQGIRDWQKQNQEKAFYDRQALLDRSRFHNREKWVAQQHALNEEKYAYYAIHGVPVLKPIL